MLNACLQHMLDWIEDKQRSLSAMGNVPSDADAVKAQIESIKVCFSISGSAWFMSLLLMYINIFFLHIV